MTEELRVHYRWVGLMGWMLALVFAQPVWAQPNSVQVQFHLQDPTYRDELGPAVPQAEEVLLKLAVGVLQNRIGFLRFTTEERPTKIVIELGNRDRSSGDSIWFYFRTTPGNSQALTWKFRSGADAVSALSKRSSVAEKIRDVDLIGDGEGQPGEFRQKFASVGLNQLVGALGALPVATGGDMSEGPPDPLWELPINRAETCMDLSSQFKIDHNLERNSGGPEDLRLTVEAVGPDGSTTDALTSHIQARVPASPDQTILIRRLAGPNVKKVKVQGVYMLDYHPRDCTAVTPPTQSGLGNGGSQ